MTTCPICGAALSAIATPPADTPPWVCGSCCRGWWNAELTLQVRDHFDASLRCFDAATAEQLELEIALERSEEA